MKEIIVTGSAGFIGFHTSKRLLEKGYKVVGIDNMNNYYDPELKYKRLSILEEYDDFYFHKLDLFEKDELGEIISSYKELQSVIHLSAQAGVRYSLENPTAYINSNIIGFFNLLETLRNIPIKHLLYASSSSVYGGNQKIPFSTSDRVDFPISLYAATKKSNELMAYTYSHLFSIPTTGLRFFTVYGPWGRPDMALYKFAEKITHGEPIDVYNHGNMSRDFTYIDDVVRIIIKLVDKPPKTIDEGKFKEKVPYSIFNVGSNNPIALLDYIECLEKHLGIKAEKNFLDIQPGDVKDTFADVSDLINYIGYSPSTKIDEGVKKFVDWFVSYNKM